MSIDEFRASLSRSEPAAGLDPALQALWWDARGNWDQAHHFAQLNEADPRAAWVHAYLHRKEGDPTNAAYWYRRAGQPVAGGELDSEWLAIARSLLAARGSNGAD